MYVFYVELGDGTELRWSGLSLAQARYMYSATSRSTPDNVLRYGWVEVK